MCNCQHDDLIHFHHDECCCDNLIHFHHHKHCHHEYEHKLNKIEYKLNTIYKQFEVIDRVEFKNKCEPIMTLYDYTIVDMTYGNGLYVAATINPNNTSDQKFFLSKDGIDFSVAPQNITVNGYKIHKILFIGNSFLLIYNKYSGFSTVVYHTFDFNEYTQLFSRDNCKINDGVFDETNNRIYLVGRNENNYPFTHPDDKKGGEKFYKLGLMLSCNCSDLNTWKDYGYTSTTNVKDNFTNVELDSIVISRHGLVVAGHYIGGIGAIIPYKNNDETISARLHISYSINGDEWLWGLRSLWDDYYYDPENGFYDKLNTFFSENSLETFNTTTNRLTLRYNDGVIIANDICGNIFSFDSLADDTFSYIMAKETMYDAITLGCVVNIDDIYLLMRYKYYSKGTLTDPISIEHSSRHTFHDYDYDNINSDEGKKKWTNIMENSDKSLYGSTHIKILNNRLFVFGDQGYHYIFDSYIVGQILRFQYDDMIRKYPLGSIYIAKDSNPNYALLLGGWREYSKDQVLPDGTKNEHDYIICIRCI